MYRVGSIVLACLLVACGQVGRSGEGGSPMRAELDLYSGRPNPTWDLTPDQVTQLRAQLDRLAETSEGEVRQDLGYRGISVTAPQGGSSVLTKVVVSNRIVIVEQGGRTRKLADKDRALERWLFQTSKGQIDAAVYDMVAQELGVQ